MKIQFGLAKRIINPEVPVSLSGYFDVRMWDHVLDDIEVRAVVFKQGPNFAAVVHFDLLTVTLKLCDEILAQLAQAGVRELNRQNITFSAIHTHTAPEIRPNEGDNLLYTAALVQKSCDAIVEALHNLQEGELLGGLTANHQYLFNRRYWMKNGHVMTNPGKLNPDIVRPEGDIDPEIPLLAVRCDGKIKLLFCNIINHTDTIGGTGVSADWSGFTRRILQQHLGAGSMVCTIIGASGNINHFDVSTGMNQTSYAEAERIGSGYAATIQQALKNLQPLSGNMMHTLFQEVVVPPREIAPQDIQAAQATIRQYANVEISSAADMTSEALAAGAPAVLKYFAQKLLEQANIKEKSHFYLTGICFGDKFILASLPGEPFVEIGLTVRKAIWGDRLCMIASHGNGTGNYSTHCGYIPNAWNYGRGGYEDTPRSNPFSQTTALTLIAAWQKLRENFD